MAKDIGESKESRQGPAQKLEWTGEDQALLDEVQRLREQENAEREAELKRLRERDLQRQRDRLRDIVQGKNMGDEGTVE